MKILIYTYYFFRSAFLRGVYNTVRLGMAELRYEKQFGIQTSAIKESQSKEFFHYQGASYLVLLRIFSDMPAHTFSFGFVDIGCGKGRVIFVAEHCGYNQLTGIEMDEQLVHDALRNSEAYSFKRDTSEINFVHINALEYTYKNQPLVYFLFNPFNEAVLNNVLDKILASSDSETWFIYMNPLYPKPFFERKMELVKRHKTRFYTEALVFRIFPTKPLSNQMSS